MKEKKKKTKKVKRSTYVLSFFKRVRFQTFECSWKESGVFGLSLFLLVYFLFYFVSEKNQRRRRCSWTDSEETFRREWRSHGHGSLRSSAEAEPFSFLYLSVSFSIMQRFRSHFASLLSKVNFFFPFSSCFRLLLWLQFVLVSFLSFLLRFALGWIFFFCFWK